MALPHAYIWAFAEARSCLATVDEGHRFDGGVMFASGVYGVL